MPASVVTVLPSGAAKPSGAAQFGSRFFLTFEDQRPICLMPTALDGGLKAYKCGIKAPTSAPTLENDAADHAAEGGLLTGDALYVAYAFYSSARVTFSQMSPAASVTVGAKKIRVSGFENPRDDAASQDIDSLVICVQSGLAAGLMAHLPLTMLFVPDHKFTDEAFVLDLSAETLEQGFNFSLADPYFALPPAVKYLDQHGERLWLGGQTRSVAIPSAGVVVTKGQSWRGQTVAKVTINGSGRFGDEHHHRPLYVSGYFLGHVWDVHSDRTVYLDRDVAASISETQTFYLGGFGDRLWPTSLHNFTMGAVPVSFPECVNLLDFQALTPAIDRGETLQGVRRQRDELAVIFDQSVVQMSGGMEVGTPFPSFRSDWGRLGAIAPRSVCADGSGALAWIGEEGICLGNSAGVQTLAFDLGCNQLFKGGRWIAPADLKNIVMTYSRAADGFVFGNFSIGGESGWWGLLSLRPQPGFWLFSGQAMTSNILECADASGQGALLAGDAYGGRVKRLLDPATLLDVPASSDAPAAYPWRVREGWTGSPDGRPLSPAVMRLTGLIAPAGDATLSVSLWRSNFAQREEGDVGATDKTSVAVSKAGLLRDVPLSTGQARFVSVEVGGLSTAGAVGARPLELFRWLTLFSKEERP